MKIGTVLITIVIFQLILISLQIIDSSHSWGYTFGIIALMIISIMLNNVKEEKTHK